MRRSLFALTALVLLGATPLLAQEHGEGGGGGGLLSVNPGLSFWTLVIFLIVLAILSKAAYPKILGAVEAREAHIAQLTEAAERDREEAAALAAENRRLVEETRARVHGAVEEARGQAEKMRAEMMDAANRERQEMLERARRDIASEREMALDTVRRDAVVLAMAAAEKLVRRNLDSEDNRRLVQESLAQMIAQPAARA
ncbi:MAG TPA: F0F1 ATP synthase subunit B [Longimicrobium sp.]|nr:F0F1 ATP synthase subunit B [Longimicrobium sp.]